MLAGELYIAADPELAEMNARAQRLLQTFNGSSVEEGDARHAILAELFGAIICPRVTLGSGTTIGAGSVVTRDIPAGVFAAGNPCRVIRELDMNERETRR